MDLHFRAFSFVDCITALDGTRITGRYHIPATLPAFANSLAAESVGQLAAWASMSQLDFSHRPVAGLAGRVELLGAVCPGQTLELSADIESVDDEAVTYRGEARVDGQPVVRLYDCVGPMMPLDQFDDPLAVRRRFELIRSHGAEPGAFRGTPDFPLEPIAPPQDNTLSALLRVPENADFFADHFPRRPVFPGTLLTHATLQLAATLMNTVAAPESGRQWAPRVISNVKLRSFIEPGSQLELRAKRGDDHNGHATVGLQVRAAGKRLGTCEVELNQEDSP